MGQQKLQQLGVIDSNTAACNLAFDQLKIRTLFSS